MDDLLKKDLKEALEITNYQINQFWPSDEKQLENLNKCLEELSDIFKIYYSNVVSKYNKTNRFDYLYTIDYTLLLFWASKLLYKHGDIKNANKLYYLNKIMHSIDWYYAIDLPILFSCEHPLGSVLGRAEYSNKLFIYQGVTIGGSGRKGSLCYPKLGENIVVYSNSSILGSTQIGNNVIIGANVKLIDENIPGNAIVFMQGNELVIVKKDKFYMEKRLSDFWKENGENEK